MNERIRELTNQCWDERLDGMHFDQEKFAELIVRECVDICENGTSTQTTSSGAAGLIKQRFGIK